ncbi:MAG: hypothetical protein KGL40_12545 [Rhodocyclaceae bacterium]|nr:hypothetical protein [Rhodocyclaceae bacterium]
MGQVLEFKPHRAAWQQAGELEAVARSGEPRLALVMIATARDLDGEVPPPLRQLEARLLAGEFGDASGLAEWIGGR